MYQNNNYSSLETRISDSNTAVSDLVSQLTEINEWIEDNKGILSDTTAPALTVSAPTATSSSSPTYTTSSSYTVSGTVSDGSGINSVTVNGTAATVNGTSWSLTISLSADVTTTLTIKATDMANNVTTVTRYVRYDSAVPSLTVSAPTATSNSSPTYTTSASYTVSGKVSDSSGIGSLKVNNSATTVNSDGTWSKSISLSANTTTTVTVVATDKAGRTSTVTRYVFYDSAVPSLTVSAPAGTSSSSPTTVASASYTVSGTVSDASGIKSVTVNGSAATISGSNWSKSLSLASGTVTTVTVVATDNAGRTSTVTRYVKYEADITVSYSDTLNVSNYQSGKPFYLIKDGVDKATNLGIGLTKLCNGGDVQYKTGYVQMTSESGYKYGFLRTTNMVNLTNYNGIKITYDGSVSVSGEVGFVGISTNDGISGSGSIDMNSTFGYMCWDSLTSTSKTTFDFTPLPKDRTGNTAYVKFGCANGTGMYVHDVLVY